ncbi:MAG: hypothetical protein EOO16_02360 [Chitinophagaceae bacterium]|nr:MAG: hypothetical protein EOO16_02360 [Chitinophagaceae bacterium]
MGIAAIPIGVDVSRVKQVFGARDRKLLDDFRTAPLYETYASQTKDFDRLLEDIVCNYIQPADRKEVRGLWGLGKPRVETGLQRNRADEYGYALLVICSYFGKQLMTSYDGFYYGRVWREMLELLKAEGLQYNLEIMFEAPPQTTFDLPPRNDFPGIYVFSQEELMEVSSFLESRPHLFVESEETDEELVEMLSDLRTSFSECVQGGVQLLTFVH